MSAPDAAGLPGDTEGRVASVRRAATAVAGVAFRPLKTLFLSVIVLVPVHIVLIGLVLSLSARFAGWSTAGDGIIGTATQWTTTAAGTIAAIFFGTIAGLAAAVTRTTTRLEESGREALLGLDGTPIEKKIPSLPLADVRTRYESILDLLVDEMLGRVRLPRFGRSLLKRGLRQAPIEDFLGDCESRGLSTVGYIEVRNWLAATGLPWAFRPIRAQAKFWRGLGVGIPAIIAVAGVIVGLVR